ncbi:MAG: hypothetical protein QHJ81_00430 [Anaerolineae bacterium]|nr:hypothetical protein [Anaerolineae bacterium]
MSENGIRIFIASVCLLALLSSCAGPTAPTTPTSAPPTPTPLPPTATPVPPTPTPVPPTPTPVPPTATPAPFALSLLHTNDTWGYMLPCG